MYLPETTFLEFIGLKLAKLCVSMMSVTVKEL